MTLDEKLEKLQKMHHFADLIEAGQMDYELMADMFFVTDVGKAAGANVTRAELLAKLHAQFPDTASLNAWLRAKVAMLEALGIMPKRPPRQH
jgi:hypothetical protein